jgi:Zn-dependent peptidase ImmA (M78 family)
MQDGGTYIDGLANYNPTDELGRPFVFINRAALNKDHRDVTLLMHEMVHLSLLIHNWNVGNCEEEIVTWAEEQCNVIFSSFLACL